MLKKVHFSIAVVVTMLCISLATPTYAYWGKLSATMTSDDAQVHIGTWAFSSVPIPIVDGPTYGLPVVTPATPANQSYGGSTAVVVDGQIFVTPSYNVSASDILNGNWNMLYLGLEWKSNTRFNSGRIVHYGDGYYLATNDSSMGLVPNLANSLYAYKTLGLTAYNPLSGYAAGSIYSYQGNIYVVNSGGQWQASVTPPSWSASVVLSYQANKAYSVDSLVTYNGGVYRAVDAGLASRQAPGLAQGAWTRIDDLQYVSTNTYREGDAVLYQGGVYQVVNAANANSSTPGQLVNAFNRVDSYAYYSFNVYALNWVVIDGSYVYQSLKSNNTSPLSDSAAWHRIN